ncbi:mevalonate kinase [Marinobacterium sp. LSUCC0821]|uniref:mevalonate kinase n=1 Tax=Marinobacterium sp. LSUCC0821 TaxID=2668067 RepID=UPI0014519169|nr:mevalonate kinase [Marinobacterium sp. LSUCC0821]QJD70461.1 mevalonate kinase [Marinobacterium sp. LSUCC0821]
MIKYSAPGNLMLMGEHAILHGEPALAMAVTKRIELTLEPLNTTSIEIVSGLGYYTSDLRHIEQSDTFAFLVAAIEQVPELSSGFKVSIESEFSHQVGLGSSAAVTAAMVAALLEYASVSVTPEEVFKRALAAVHQVQNGRGSGTDLAACIYGGIVAYEMAERVVRPLASTPDIDLYFVGYKMKTPDVLALVESYAQRSPEIYANLYRLMGDVTRATEVAINKSDLAQLGQLMNQYSGLMEALGVCDQQLAKLQYQLRAEPDVMGVKISGSGLGDCVLALGKADPKRIGFDHIPVSISKDGLRRES